MTKAWFKPKRYGWGWFPISIEGWLFTGLFALFIYLWAQFTNMASSQKNIMLFMIGLLVMIIISIPFFNSKSTEKAKWRWG